jgi:hypothetical protein
MQEAFNAMVVHHSGRLHVRIHDGRADELEASLGKVFRQAIG